MTRYVDTSVLLALFLNEAKTADAWGWLKGAQGMPLFASQWTLTEFSSALGVKAGMRAIDEAERQQIFDCLPALYRCPDDSSFPDPGRFHPSG